MKKTLIFLLCCGILSITCLTARADDSIPKSGDDAKVTELGELVVKAERGWVEKDKIVFIPTKQEKKLANSAASLIASMHLPGWKGEGDAITGPGGKTATVFINGLPANDTDLSTFWPMLAKRVELIENPSDPKYLGASLVVNFIMTEYEAGGVTKLNARQDIPFLGIYSASSKLEYKDMTFGVKASYNYQNFQTSYIGTESYRDLWYKDNFYDLIERTLDEKEHRRNDVASVVFDARYVKNKFKASHTAAYTWKRNPGSFTKSSDIWSPDLFDGDFSNSGTNSKTIAASVSGLYTYQFNDKWYLNGSWGYTYAKNTSSSESTTAETPTIYNSNDEDVNTLKIIVMPTFQVSPKITLQFMGTGTFDWYSTRYHGSNNDRYHQKRQELSGELKFYWNPSDRITFGLLPGIQASIWETGDYKENYVRPYAAFYFGWNPSRKFRFNAWMDVSMHPANASQNSDAIVRASELTWHKGNPLLKGNDYWYGTVNCTWIPFNWFNMAARVSYSHNRNKIVKEYAVADKEMGGLIVSDYNASPQHSASSTIDINVNFFDHKLYATLTPSYEFTNTEGLYKRSLHHLKIYGSIGSSIKNCDFRISYSPPQKVLGDAGASLYRQAKGSWSFDFAYGTGTWYFGIGVSNIFNKKQVDYTTLNTAHYSRDDKSLITGRNLELSLSYTFGYGKKVSRSIDIGSSGDIKTSVVN